MESWTGSSEDLRAWALCAIRCSTGVYLTETTARTMAASLSRPLPLRAVQMAVNDLARMIDDDAAREDVDAAIRREQPVGIGYFLDRQLAAVRKILSRGVASDDDFRALAEFASDTVHVEALRNAADSRMQEWLRSSPGRRGKA